jgi:hypothetical protein
VTIGKLVELRYPETVLPATIVEPFAFWISVANEDPVPVIVMSDADRSPEAGDTVGVTLI